MIIEEYDESLFISRFEDYKRVDNFGYAGLRALFNYLDELYTEENPLKLDVISLCCDFNKYNNVEEYLRDYNTDLNKKDYDNEDDFKQALEEEINEKTLLIKISEDLNEGFIIQAF